MKLLREMVKWRVSGSFLVVWHVWPFKTGVKEPVLIQTDESWDQAHVGYQVRQARYDWQDCVKLCSTTRIAAGGASFLLLWLRWHEPAKLGTSRCWRGRRLQCRRCSSVKRIEMPGKAGEDDYDSGLGSFLAVGGWKISNHICSKVLKVMSRLRVVSLKWLLLVFVSCLRTTQGGSLSWNWRQETQGSSSWVDSCQGCLATYQGRLGKVLPITGGDLMKMSCMFADDLAAET